VVSRGACDRPRGVGGGRDTGGVRRAVKVRLYPDPAQEALFAQTAGAARWVFNTGLAVRRDAWQDDQISVSTNDLMAMLPLWKEEFGWLREVSDVALQQSLRNLDVAYGNFFRACRGEGRARFPRFKTRNSRVAFRLTRNGFRVKDGQFYVAKNDQPVTFRDKGGYEIPADATSVTISKDAAGRWHASFLVDDVVPLPHQQAGEMRVVGVDLGIKTLAVTSDGDEFENPKHFDKHARRLAKYQRMMSRRKPAPGQRASNNYRKAQHKAGRVHARIADARRDTIHQTTTALARRYDIVCIEDLNVAGMVKNKKLARAISDAGFGEFRRQLEYKTTWYGTKLIVLDRWHPSSRLCHVCGWKNSELRLSDRQWTCRDCGTLHDRDLNAAKVIASAGLADYACGGDIRPQHPVPLDGTGNGSGNSRETGNNPTRALARAAA